MRTFEVIPGDASSRVVLHVPHSSTHIPGDVRADILLNDHELSAELSAITDADTDRVALGAAELVSVRPWIFVNRTSRLVVDPERFPDEREEMNAVGMGAVYERTTDLRILREPSQGQRQDLIDRYFTPYADALAELVRDRLEAAGDVTVVDVHSYPQTALPYELHGSGPRPEICIGTDSFHTPAHLRLAAVEAMSAVGGIGLDSPFAGCYVPLEQYGTNRHVRGVMLEIRRDVVAARMDQLQHATARLVTMIDQPEGVQP
ncbi:N-formylglutamate amidohydrolase [Nocardioides ultimimeridianus]